MDLQQIVLNNSLSNLMNELQMGFSKPLMKEKNEDGAVKYLIDERKKHIIEMDQYRKHGVLQRYPNEINNFFIKRRRERH